jgi:hypothetical protein
LRGLETIVVIVGGPLAAMTTHNRPLDQGATSRPCGLEVIAVANDQDDGNLHGAKLGSDVLDPRSNSPQLQ